MERIKQASGVSVPETENSVLSFYFPTFCCDYSNIILCSLLNEMCYPVNIRLLQESSSEGVSHHA